MTSTEDTTAGKDDNDVSVCANCGKGEEESNKLKHCNACMMVKYCNRECQIAHRPQHKKECRKRAAELHDEKLFKQPPPLHEDCPICFLRMPILETGNKYMACCGKMICTGCVYAPVYDNQGNKIIERKCPFCRAPYPKSIKEENERLKKRVEVNDLIAIYNLGVCYRDGMLGFAQNNNKALELWQKAGELGYGSAYNSIGYTYSIGRGVERDKKKAVYYYEQAAMGGDTVARANLGNDEWRAGNKERALKHYMIAVRDGHENSLKIIQTMYFNGHATKDDYTKALRSYQEYLSEIKSKQRDEAAAADARLRYYESGV